MRKPYMKMNKSLLTLALSTLLTNPINAAGSFNLFSNFDIPGFIDDLVAGGPLNYYHDFPKEDIENVKHGYEFNNLIILGDSIGDQGSSGRKYLYIAGGYDSPMYLEYLSLALTGKHSAPYTVGGLNYSLKGSSMLRVQENRKSIQEQYHDYLQKYNDKADPKSIYVLWGGNMDLNVLVAKNLPLILLGKYDLNAPDYTLNNSPQATADIAQDLINHGAPYVFVANIPDGTIFPYSMLVTVEQVVETVIAPFKVPYTWIITAAGRKVDNYARNPNNTVEANGRYFFRNNHINAMYSQLYWMLPKAPIEFMYDATAYLQDKTIAQYNNSLNKALKNVNGNIIYFDFDRLLNEIAYNYKSYGLDTVLVPTCTLGYSSRFCDIGSRNYHSQISLFSDWFHPSPQLHLMIAQTMQSIFNAPVYASSIARQANNVNLSREFFINNQLNNLRNQADSQNNNQLSLFVGYSGSANKSGVYVNKNTTHTNVLNIGMYSYINPQWLVGSAVSLGFGENKPHNNFHYDFNHQNLSFFTQYTFNNNFWLSFNLGIGRLSAENIIRSTIIYKNTVYHEGTTKAYSYNSLAKIGTDIYRDETQQTGLTLELGINKFTVNGYQEKGKEFLAMKYKKYNYNKNHAGIGWYYHNQALKIVSNPVQFSFETTIGRRLGKNNQFKIPASLTTAPVMFNREIKDINKQWFNSKIGAEVNLNKKSTLSSNLGYSSDFKRNHNINYSLGFKYQF